MSRPLKSAERKLLMCCTPLALVLAVALGACDRSKSEPAPSSQETTAAPAEVEWVTREISEYRIKLSVPGDWKIAAMPTKNNTIARGTQRGIVSRGSTTTSLSATPQRY